LTNRYARIWLTPIVAAVSAACASTPPVNYALPPGLSASFSPSALQLSERYARTFCSVLAEPALASQGWERCDSYVQMAAQQPDAAPPPAIPTQWTLLLIGGFGAECFVPTIEAFSDAAEHLDRVHQVKSHRVPVTAFGSSEENAALILKFIKTLPPTGKYIVVAHSKGAADVMVALATYPTELTQIKAIITVAGAVGGSWIVDDFRELNDKVVKTMGPLPCQPAVDRRAAGNGIDSMRREIRQKFLAANEPTAPAYSISAVATEAQMSSALKPLWRRLRPYGLEQDSHIVERESIVPWGHFLARALGDHWAVAMPVHGNPKVKPDTLKLVDRNRYPRVALIEAAVRIVTARLPAD